MKPFCFISSLLFVLYSSVSFAYTGAYKPKDVPADINSVTIKVTNIALDNQCSDYEFCFRAFVWLNDSEEANASFPVSPGSRANKTKDGDFNFKALTKKSITFNGASLKSCSSVSGNPETEDGSVCFRKRDAAHLFKWIKAANNKVSLLVEDMSEIKIPVRQTFNGNESVQVEVSIKEQRLRLWIDDVFKYEWKVSTGTGSRTPTSTFNPNGRVYTKYSSRKYPGGNYVAPNGRKLGNMPYAMFYNGGLAIHGTPRNNWSKLGRKASHGCTRVHPFNALILNNLVKEYGVDDVRFTHY